MSRTCIFCDGRPVTKEHLIPEWAFGFLQGIVPPGTPPGVRGSRGMNDTPKVTWSSDEPTLVIGCVCAPCNNGWMSDIEASVQAFLGPMIQGARVGLDSRMRQELATWICVKSLVWGSSRADPFARRWYEEFSIHREPPMTWHVRIARYRGTRPFRIVGMPTELVGRTTSQHFEGFRVTMRLGRFVGQVIGTSILYSPESDINFCTPIWPQSEVVVGPNSSPREARAPLLALDDSGFQDFVQLGTTGETRSPG